MIPQSEQVSNRILHVKEPIGEVKNQESNKKYDWCSYRSLAFEPLRFQMILHLEQIIGSYMWKMKMVKQTNRNQIKSKTGILTGVWLLNKYISIIRIRNDPTLKTSNRILHVEDANGEETSTLSACVSLAVLTRKYFDNGYPELKYITGISLNRYLIIVRMLNKVIRTCAYIEVIPLNIYKNIFFSDACFAFSSLCCRLYLLLLALFMTFCESLPHIIRYLDIPIVLIFS